jgi:hypothetical protein
MILLLSYPDDPSAQRAASILRERGVAFVHFDPKQYPATARLTLSYGTDGALRAVLIDGDRRVALDEVTAVWYRRPGIPTAHARVTDADIREYARNEAIEVLYSLWKALAEIGRCRFVPGHPLQFVERAGKPHQLAAAGRLGFEIPPTIITNDPDELRAFVRAHGRCMTKPIDTAVWRAGGLDKRMGRFATLITHRDLGYTHTVRDCPALVQGYVEKKIEIRATVVGDRVFAAEIHSQASQRTRHDWRHYDRRRTPHLVHDLPPAIADRCVEICSLYGLCYGAIDLVLTPDDRYVFLELNYNGQYDWIEERTGLPITAAICDLLTAPVPAAPREA